MNARLGFVDRFKAQVEAAGGKVVVCRSREEAVGVVRQELYRRNLREVLGGGLGGRWASLKESLESWGAKLLETPPRLTPDKIPEVGIGEAEYAVAETGTLVEVAWHRERLLSSLLPPVHIALLDEDRIVPDLDSLFVVLLPLLSQGPRPRVVCITGPSRSADIEKLLILGAHGPRELVVVLSPP
ncbi:MAG: lactate utilization protein [Armatimonadota bacterium]|nr:lactate utilization protein [Armatimonadota bacterium]MDR5704303.1 lactate utilization protein [Armatimonadota bacterium]